MTTAMEHQDSTQALAKLAQDGDRDAFDAIVLAYETKLQHHVETRVGPHLRSKVEVEDVVQEAFARAWTSIGTFQWTTERAFFAWLRTIAERVILHLARRHKGDRVIYREEDGSNDDPSPSKMLRREQRFDRLESALSRLSPDYREAVRLVRIERLQIQDVARRMKRSRKAVSHLVSRGLKQLREVFGDTESLHLPDRRIEDRSGESHGDGKGRNGDTGKDGGKDEDDASI